MSDLLSLRARFRAFGFVVLPGALDRDEAAALTAEAQFAVRDATGESYRAEADDLGHYIPATGGRTPVSVALTVRFAPLVADLLGVAVIPVVVQHALLFDMISWHTDTGHAVPSAKVVAYTEELDAATGALRVLPGSHRLDVRVLVDLLHGPAFRSQATAAQATREVPGHVIASRPGDVIVFDERLWHASVNGRFRHQWSACYVLDPGTPEEEFAARRYLASQFSPGEELDYDPTHYPHYGAGLRSAGVPAHWWDALRSLGAIEAAEAEQRMQQRTAD